MQRGSRNLVPMLRDIHVRALLSSHTDNRTARSRNGYLLAKNPDRGQLQRGRRKLSKLDRFGRLLEDSSAEIAATKVIEKREAYDQLRRTRT
jgi:hypothetical protein